MFSTRRKKSPSDRNAEIRELLEVVIVHLDPLQQWIKNAIFINVIGEKLNQAPDSNSQNTDIVEESSSCTRRHVSLVTLLQTTFWMHKTVVLTLRIKNKVTSDWICFLLV